MVAQAATYEGAPGTTDVSTGWLFGFGILNLLLGIAALTFPVAATLAVDGMVGALFLIAGVTQIVYAFKARGFGGFLAAALIGLLQAAAGAAFIVFPIAGSVSLTAFVAILFILDGVFRVAYSVQVRPQAGWGWVTFSGVIGVLAGLLVVTNLLPASFVLLGALLGVHLMLTGMFLIQAGIASRSQTQPEHP